MIHINIKSLYTFKVGDRFSVVYNDKIYHCKVIGFTPFIIVDERENKSRYPILYTEKSYKYLHNGFLQKPIVQYCHTFVLTPELYEKNKILNGNKE